MDRCPDCDGALKVAPDFVVGMDCVGSIYTCTVVCLACMMLWGRRGDGGLVTAFSAEEAVSAFHPVRLTHGV